MELTKLGDFEAALLDYMNSSHADLMQKVNDTGDWNDELENEFKSAFEDFKKNHAY
ncbi:MAG: hypothetical protein V3T39_05385 [Gammaproteobacteria bacterium]